MEILEYPEGRFTFSEYGRGDGLQLGELLWDSEETGQLYVKEECTFEEAQIAAKAYYPKALELIEEAIDEREERERKEEERKMVPVWRQLLNFADKFEKSDQDEYHIFKHLLGQIDAMGVFSDRKIKRKVTTWINSYSGLNGLDHRIVGDDPIKYANQQMAEILRYIVAESKHDLLKRTAFAMR